MIARDSAPKTEMQVSVLARAANKYIFFAAASQCLEACSFLLVLPPYFKLTAACCSHQANNTIHCGQGSGAGCLGGARVLGVGRGCRLHLYATGDRVGWRRLPGFVLSVS